MADEPKETQEGPVEEAVVSDHTDLTARIPPAATSVAEITRLLHAAVEKKIPVETMERLVALHERMSDRAAASEFAAALVRFQRACPIIARTSRADIVTGGGAKFHYKYAELDEIVRTIRDLLHECGLSYSWDSNMSSDNVLTCTCTLQHVNGHRAQASFTAPAESRAGMSAAQKVAAALTFARRYSLIQVLGLTTCDPDTDAALGSFASITDDQVEVLEKLIADSTGDRARLLNYMRVKTLGDIQVRHFGAAVAALEQKRKGQSHDRS